MRTGLLVGTGAAAVALGLADTVYRTRQWGATARESSLPLPGDRLVAEPARTVTRGVTVHASPEDVWQWVVEVGRARGGVELVPGRSMVLLGGLADEGERAPRDAITTLHVVPLGPRGTADGTAHGTAHGTARGRADGRADGTAGWCRLLCRSRGRRTSTTAAALSVVLEPVGLVLTRRLLLGVKQRAERAARPERAGRSLHRA